MNKSNIMSLSVDLEIQERLKKVAKKRNVSVSKMVRDMIDKHLVAEDEAVVVLKIPADVKSNAQELQKWLIMRFDGIVKALTT